MIKKLLKKIFLNKKEMQNAKFKDLIKSFKI